MSPNVSVIIPTLDEADNLRTVLPKIGSEYEIIVVDGGSTDTTIEVARNIRPDCTILTQTRRGKGNALVTGFQAATGNIIVMFDADGSADPNEIPKFVQTIVSGADFAKGTRYNTTGGSDDLTLIRSLGNRLLNKLFNWCYQTRHTDLCYGYNAFKTNLLPALNLPDPKGVTCQWGDGFEIETLLNCRFAAANAVTIEVGSHEKNRIHGVSHLHPIKDGLRVLKTILTEKRWMLSN